MDLNKKQNIGVAVDDEYDTVDNNPDIENDCDEAIMTNTWTYHDEDMPKNSQCVGKGKYDVWFDAGKRNNVSCSDKWSDYHGSNFFKNTT